MKTGGAISTANRYGIWLWDPLQFGLVARAGNAARLTQVRKQTAASGLCRK